MDEGASLLAAASDGVVLAASPAGSPEVYIFSRQQQARSQCETPEAVFDPRLEAKSPVGSETDTIALAWSPDSSRLAVATAEGHVMLIDRCASVSHVGVAHCHIQLAYEMSFFYTTPARLQQTCYEHNGICRQGRLLADWSSHAWGTRGIAGLCFPASAADQGLWVLSSKCVVFAASHGNTSPQPVLSLKVSLNYFME